MSHTKRPTLTFAVTIRWIRRLFDFTFDLEGLDLDDVDVEGDLAAGQM